MARGSGGPQRRVVGARAGPIAAQTRRRRIPRCLFRVGAQDHRDPAATLLTGAASGVGDRRRGRIGGSAEAGLGGPQFVEVGGDGGWVRMRSGGRSGRGEGGLFGPGRARRRREFSGR